MHAHFLGEYLIICTFSYAPFHSPSFTGRIRPRQEGQESENGMYTMAPVLLLPLIVSQPYIVPIPFSSADRVHVGLGPQSRSRLVGEQRVDSLLQKTRGATWETSC
jgi:hypothetical protein